MAEIQLSSTGLSGEYFVAAELLRRGFTVGITMGNAKGIDILAEKNDRQFVVQVIAICKQKNIGWPIMQNKIKPEYFYVFVNLNGNKMTEPEYFICLGEEAIPLIKQYEKRGIINRYSLNNENYKGRWDRII